MLPYYDWLERDKSSASVGTVFQILTFFTHQNIGSVPLPPPTSTVENARLGATPELYFVLFINIYAPTQFVQDTAILLTQAFCVVATDCTPAPSQ